MRLTRTTVALLSGSSLLACWMLYSTVSEQQRVRLQPVASWRGELHGGSVRVELPLHASSDPRSGRRLPPPRLADLAAAVGTLLTHPVPTPLTLNEATLRCVQYSGPCFFMNHPRGSDAPTRPVRAAARPDAVEQQLPLRPTRVPLRPFSLHNVSLLPGTRFHLAQHTNLEWLHRLEPDRLLYYFRNLSGVPQPAGVKPHGGWDGAGTGLRGHMAGHYLTAASLAAATTGDTLLLQRLEYITASLAECQRAGGDGCTPHIPACPHSQRMGNL